MTKRSDSLITRAQLHKRINMGRTQLYDNCKEGGQLYPAMVGAKVDLSHAAAVKFCKKYGYEEPDDIDVVKVAQKFEESSDESDQKSASDILNMTLGEITNRYGKLPQFKEYVQVNKILVDTRGKEEEQERKRGEYIHRVHAERIIAMIDALNSSLLNEAAVSIATTVGAQVKAGAGKKQIERSVHDVISRTIKTTKSKVVRSLRDG